jgi:hypothetical protein
MLILSTYHPNLHIEKQFFNDNSFSVVSSDHVNEIVERMKKALNGDKAVVMISAVDDLVML